MTHDESLPSAIEQRSTVGNAVGDILAVIPPQIAQALRLGAIPHWFDEELLAHLSGAKLDVSEVRPYLQQFGFVKQDALGHFRYDREVRDYLLGWWRDEGLEEYRAASRLAQSYFEVQSQSTLFVERPMYEREVLYHLLATDETAGLKQLATLFEDALARYQRGQAESFAAQAMELMEILSPQGCLWTQYFQARLDLVYRRGDAGEETFRTLADQEGDPVLQAVAQWSLGIIHQKQHDWSKAIKLYNVGLKILQRERSWMYGARVMLALGDAYRDLAEASGGFQEEADAPQGGIRRLLHVLQHMPFLAYEWLVRRIGLLPSWLFGTNYQNWIIAYLLRKAMGWYRRAEKQLEQIDDTLGLTQTQLYLGELEHQLGRWSRAHRRYEQLLEVDEVRSSLYRTARVWLGQGRAFLYEGHYSTAETVLLATLETFRRFEDQESIGVTAALLGRLYVALDLPEEAVSACLESAKAFEAAEKHLAQTRVLWTLEDIARQPNLSDKLRQQIDRITEKSVERQYIARFPDALLRWFRRLALWGALPITYVLAFILGLALTLTLLVVEGELAFFLTGANVQTTTLNVLILMAAASLPVLLSLWIYRLIYTVAGAIFVWWRGRKLVPIEEEQPRRFITNATGLVSHDTSTSSGRTVRWSDVSLFVSIDQYQWKQTIHLISRSALSVGFGLPLIVPGITTGYEHLQQDISNHLSYEADGATERHLDLAYLDGRWVVSAILVSLAFALFTIFAGHAPLTYVDSNTSQEVTAWLSSIMLAFVPTLLLTFPALTLWRLVYHRIHVQHAVEYQATAIPLWLLWLAAIVCTLIAILWMLLVIFWALGEVEVG
jgi:tetratricopeptide (TPR) repeat protein